MAIKFVTFFIVWRRFADGWKHVSMKSDEDSFYARLKLCNVHCGHQVCKESDVNWWVVKANHYFFVGLLWNNWTINGLRNICC